ERGGAASDISGLSEEEMLQMAMAASLEQGAAEAPQDDGAAYVVTDEPADGAEGSCRIQFRLPDGTRSVREREDDRAEVGIPPEGHIIDEGQDGRGGGARGGYDTGQVYLEPMSGPPSREDQSTWLPAGVTAI
ncbi:hypothetical protein THAOC_01452, partial [Thalassiosira oceanica]